MLSPVWTDSAMIFTYDEAGGYYDHVPPQPIAAPGGDPGSTVPPYSPYDLNPALDDICTKPGEVLGQGTCDFAWTGYRVPLIVISPYAVKNFVSHNIRDTTAVLKMVETRFGVAPLTGRDAAQLDMTEFFDFVNKPWETPPTPPHASAKRFVQPRPAGIVERSPDACGHHLGRDGLCRTVACTTVNITKC